MGGGFDAVRPAAEVIRVEIHLQDFIFRISAFDFYGGQDFFDLAGDRLFPGQE